MDQFRSFKACQLLSQSPGCHGNGAVLVTLASGVAVMGVHFLLDFKNRGVNSNTARCARAAASILDKYSEAYTVGDMNTVSGMMNDAVIETVATAGWKLSKHYYTFLPSFFDTVVDGSETFAELVDIETIPIPE